MGIKRSVKNRLSSPQRKVKNLHVKKQQETLVKYEKVHHMYFLFDAIGSSSYNICVEMYNELAI